MKDKIIQTSFGSVLLQRFIRLCLHVNLVDMISIFTPNFLHSAKACWPSWYQLQWSAVVVWNWRSGWKVRDINSTIVVFFFSSLIDNVSQGKFVTLFSQVFNPVYRIQVSTAAPTKRLKVVFFNRLSLQRSLSGPSG